MISFVLTLATLAAAPVVIEPLGFSVTVKPAGVTVVAVTPGSVAARSGLTPGVVITLLASPQWPFVRGPLAQLSPEDLHDALTPPHDEPLILMATVAELPRQFLLVREDPAPDYPFAGPPLSKEQLARLTFKQQALYAAGLLRGPGEMASRGAAPLSISDEVTAVTGKEGLHEVWRGAWTPEWVYFEGRVRFQCPSSPMRRIELAGAGPLPKVLATSNDPTLQGSSVPAQLPLWRVRDVLAACGRGETQLTSSLVTATLRCEGQPPRTVELSHPLTLKCGQAQRPPSRLDGLRIRSSETVLTDTAEPVTLRVSWTRLKPTPVAAAVVELDDTGTEARRHPALKVPTDADGETQTEVPVDTSKPRTLGLALWVKFPDGTTDRSAAEKLTIETPAQREAEHRAMDERFARMTAVQERLSKAFAQPCQAPDETVKWLRAQPEVSTATNHNGHNLSYVIDGVPMMLLCHRR